MNEQDGWDDQEDYLLDEWVSLSEAVRMLGANTSSSYISAKADIIELIADCKLQLRSQKVREEADIGVLKWGMRDDIKAYARQQDKGFKFNARNQHEPMPMANGFWGRTDGWCIDASRVNWEDGTIVGLRPTRQKEILNQDHNPLFTRRAATGVIVKVNSIRALSPINGVEAIVETRNSQADAGTTFRLSNRGRKKSDAWNVWFAEVAVFLESNGIEAALTKPDFHAAINERLEGRDKSQELLPYTTVEKAIGTIFNRLREAKTSGEI